MHRALSSRWVRYAFSIGDRAALAEVPVYLCPSLSAASMRHSFAPADARQKLPYRQRSCVHVETVPVSETASELPQIPSSPPAEPPSESPVGLAKRLPLICSGCGALSQTTEVGQAGYYDLDRKAVREHVFPKKEEAKKEAREEDKVVEAALQNLGEEKLKELGLDPHVLRHGEELESDRPTKGPSPKAALLCDRCHNLIHHHVGEPIFHPTIDSIRETIEESPFKNNHIYHVIDAADFPMSFIPKLHLVLDANLKHRNRRNKSGRYYKNRKFDMDFIITRSDLLAPKKEMVDSKMPYLRDVLRKSLGKFGRLITLGNVRCVSAERGWWTKDVKHAIYYRGGAGWMVGKVNVGKSKLFDTVFPKGTMLDIPIKNKIEISMFAKEEDSEESHYLTDDANGANPSNMEQLDMDSLLPPARAETNYPDMPTVSSLPGTTASPIRIPFGNGKGELIDLPGIARSDLEKYVKPEHRKSLIMQQRIKPEQHTLKPGQSLLLGGLIRISPATPDLVFLAYNFTPIPEHRTCTAKAIEFHKQTRQAPAVHNFAIDGIGEKMKLARAVQLRYDVTKERAGPLTRKDVGKKRVEDLPFRVLATDILIEGVGWVEVVAQVRAKHLYEDDPAYSYKPESESIEKQEEEEEEALNGFARLERASKAQASGRGKLEAPPKPKEPNWPVIEVYSPEGKFVGERPPFNGWLLNKAPKKDIKARPRKSMKGAKKAAKQATRERAANIN